MAELLHFNSNIEKKILTTLKMHAIINKRAFLVHGLLIQPYQRFKTVDLFTTGGEN